MKPQTDPYGKAMKNYVNKGVKQKYICLKKLPNISVWKQTFFRGWRKFDCKPKYRAIGLNIYIFVLLFCLRNSSSPCCKDQFAVSYFVYKFNCTDPDLQLEDFPITHWFVAVDLLISYIFWNLPIIAHKRPLDRG